MADLDRLPYAIAAVAPHMAATYIETWTDAMTPPLRAAGIVTPNRIAMFLGQCAVESEQFNVLVEDLFYTTAERIVQEYPNEVPDLTTARSLIGSPAALANRVYANRNGNGDETSGDGWRYRGRGLIQVTGRANYAVLTAFDARAANPDWLMTPTGAVVSAVWFLTVRVHGFLALCDGWEVTRCTEVINGPAREALSDRIAACNAALIALKGNSAPGGVSSPSSRVAPSVPAPDSGHELTADELDSIYNPGA